MSEFLRICEVGTRDGLQNEKAAISTADKQYMIDSLIDAGLQSLELTSFVKADAVPQMSDAETIMAYTRQTHPAAQGVGLIFNEQGYERALACGAQAVALVLIVSDSLSRANTGKTADEWLQRYRTLIPRIRENGTWLRVYLAAAWVCPYEGQISPERTLRYADQIWEMGVDELCPTDVIGHAQPLQVGELMETLGQRFEMGRLAVHLHDTQALGLANAYAAIQAGVRVVDSSVGGLGGCPFAPGSAGNLATEDLVFLAHKMGYATGIDRDKLWVLVDHLEKVIGRKLGGRTPRP
jgi:hydroxymethylglutaryl-CoA lyase